MKTNIEWASHSLNPYGWVCQKCSPGCTNCYMMTLARRQGKNPTGAFYTRWPAAERELRQFPTGAVVFVNSMSDTYYQRAPDADVHRVHNMALAHPDQFFLVLTKRPERAYYMRHLLAWPDNLWLGVSVENADHLWRASYALATGAKHVFISAEPLLSGLATQLRSYLIPSGCPWRDIRVPDDVYEAGRGNAIEWVIVGGESGPDRRLFDKRWAESIRHSCAEFDVPFMFKQGSAYKPGQDRMLDGYIWNERPAAFGIEMVVPEEAAAPMAPVQMRLFEMVNI